MILDNRKLFSAVRSESDPSASENPLNQWKMLVSPFLDTQDIKIKTLFLKLSNPSKSRAMLLQLSKCTLKATQSKLSWTMVKKKKKKKHTQKHRSYLLQCTPHNQFRYHSQCAPQKHRSSYHISYLQSSALINLHSQCSAVRKFTLIFANLATLRKLTFTMLRSHKLTLKIQINAQLL